MLHGRVSDRLIDLFPQIDVSLDASPCARTIGSSFQGSIPLSFRIETVYSAGLQIDKKASECK